MVSASSDSETSWGKESASESASESDLFCGCLLRKLKMTKKRRRKKRRRRRRAQWAPGSVTWRVTGSARLGGERPCWCAPAGERKSTQTNTDEQTERGERR